MAPGRVLRVTGITRPSHEKFDPRAPEDTYNAWSRVFAQVAEKEPPAIVP